MSRHYDFAVIGAGVFGAWTAHFLLRNRSSVILLDAYGPGNSRASSGGETRVIRMGYGPDELYTRWAMRSLPQWRELAERTGRELFIQSGVLWVGQESDSYLKSLMSVLSRNGVRTERLSNNEVAARWPQLRLDDISQGILEPESGLLMARSGVQALVKDLIQNGIEFQQAAVIPPSGQGKLAAVQTAAGERISAGGFIFACGPWLPKVFPTLLRERIFPSRQEVFFIGPPAGTDDFRVPKMPVWLHRTHPGLPYALPDVEGRGFKIAFYRHGGAFDPDDGSRVVPASSLDELRVYLKKHIPALGDAAVIETRVCQYENTWNGDFLIDQHPELENVWIAGGGSGHGFKHGPALGEYLTGRMLKGTPGEMRFSLAAKQSSQQRAIY